MDPEERDRLIDSMLNAGKSKAEIKAFLQQHAASQSAKAPETSPEAAPPPEPRETVGGTLKRLGGSLIDVDRKILNGLSVIGIGPQIEGAISNAIAPGSYGFSRDRATAGNERFGREHPVVSTIAELAGGAVPFAFSGGESAALSKAPGFFSRIAQGIEKVTPAAPKLVDEAGKVLGLGGKMKEGIKLGAKAGALTGGGSAVAHGDGSFFDRIGQVAKGAAMGTAAGTVLGGVGVPVGEAVVGTARAGAKVLTPALKRVAASLQRTVGNEAGFVGKAAPPSSGPMKALFGQEPTRAESKALRLTNDRFGAIPEDAQVMADRAERELVGADVGGESFQSLFGTAVAKNTPAGKEARPFLAARGQNRGARMAEDVTTATGMEPVNLAEAPNGPKGKGRTVREQEIRDADRPAINAAYRKTDESPPVAISEATTDMLARPLGKRAVEEASALAQNEADPAKRILQIGGEKAEASVGSLDAVAKRLKAMKRESKDDNERRLIDQILAEVGNDLATDEAQAAATSLAGESLRAQQAVQAGKRLGGAKSTVDDITTALDAMSPREQEEARRAMAQVRRQSLMENADAVLAPRRAVNTDLKTRAQYGDEAADELGRRNDLELAMRGTETSFGGSQTAERLLNNEAIEGGKLSPVDLLSLPRAVAHFGLDVGRRAFAPGRDKADALVRIGLAGKDNPMDLQALMQSLRGMRKEDANKLAAALRASGSLGSLAGRAVGGP